MMRRRWTLAFVVAVSGWIPSCDERPRECAAARCLGFMPPLELVDDAGHPAAARGEWRTRSGPAAPSAGSFDCAPEGADAGTASCTDGMLSLASFDVQPQNVVDLRFELADGRAGRWCP